MSLRETLNRNPAVTSAVVIVVIILAVVALVWWQKPSSVPTKAFYTTDDGKTWFKDSIELLAPVTIDGKEAYRVYVFKCGGEKFAGYLERYTPEAKKAIETMKVEGNKPNVDGYKMMELNKVMQIGQQFKKPGDKEWISMADPRFEVVRNMPCPGSSEPAQRVQP